MHFSKKIHCATLKKNRSSDNFLIQKNILIFCTKSKIQDSPSMLYYRLCCIIRRPYEKRREIIYIFLIFKEIITKI